MFQLSNTQCFRCVSTYGAESCNLVPYFPVNFIVYYLALAIFGTVQWHSPLEHQRTTF